MPRNGTVIMTGVDEVGDCQRSRFGHVCDSRVARKFAGSTSAGNIVRRFGPLRQFEL